MTPGGAAHPGIDAAGPRDKGAIPRSATPRAPEATTAWLTPLFYVLSWCAPASWLLRPIICAVVPLVRPSVRRGALANARRIFGRELSRPEQRRFVRNTVGSFYDFLVDVERSSRLSRTRLERWVEEIEGEGAYRETRKAGRGAVLVTAHLGSFEAGLVALAGAERRIHVVFKRDTLPAFERLRSRLRESLGIVEAPIDEGIGTWLALRAALERDEVVVMQGDRALRGQRSVAVPFLHGSLRIPTGPVQLAQITGAPIIPVFVVRSGGGNYRVLLGQAIRPNPAAGPSGDPRALRALADAIAAVVARFPTQWLALSPVFEEDAEHG